MKRESNGDVCTETNTLGHRPRRYTIISHINAWQLVESDDGLFLSLCTKPQTSKETIQRMHLCIPDARKKKTLGNS